MKPPINLVAAKRAVMRRMKPGESIVTRQTGNSAGSEAATVGSRIGGKFITRAAILFKDGPEPWCQRVIITTCLKAAPKFHRKPRSRATPEPILAESAENARPVENEKPAIALDEVQRLALRPREAAQALGISPRTLSQLARDGMISRVRLSRNKQGATLYPLASLQEFLQRQPPGEKP